MWCSWALQGERPAENANFIPTRGQILGLTLDSSTTESREDLFGGKGLTFSTVKGVHETLARGSPIFINSAGPIRSGKLDQSRKGFICRCVSLDHVRPLEEILSKPVGLKEAKGSLPLGPPGFRNLAVAMPRRGRVGGRRPGRGRGCRLLRFFSRITKGPGHDWHLRSARGGLVLVPAEDPSPPESPVSCIEDSRRSESLEYGEFRPTHGMMEGCYRVNALEKGVEALAERHSEALVRREATFVDVGGGSAAEFLI